MTLEILSVYNCSQGLTNFSDLIGLELDKLSLYSYLLVGFGHFEKLLAVNVTQDEMKIVLHKTLIDKLLLNFLCCVIRSHHWNACKPDSSIKLCQIKYLQKTRLT